MIKRLESVVANRGTLIVVFGAAEFLKMNPCHTIPTMTDGPDFHLFEATAILQYIANKYKLTKCKFSFRLDKSIGRQLM